MIDVLKIAFLFLGVWFTTVNMFRCINKCTLPPANIFYQAIGITGFVYLQWLM